MFIPFNTLIIVAGLIFLLGFVSPFALICYIVMRAKTD
jgi:hypothetical protein